jgi:hypothetical protein
MLTHVLFATTLLSGALTPDTTVRFARGGLVEIDVPTCAVTVRVGNEDRLIVSGGEAELSGRTAEISCGDFPFSRGRNGSRAVVVTVPPSTRVEINTLGGAVEITGATERLDVTTMQGSIRVTNGGGRTSLESVAGSITVGGFTGTTLMVDAVAGEVALTDIAASERVSVEGVNGVVRMVGMRAPSVRATSVNGEVLFGGTLAPDGNYAFENHNGGITLTLARTVSARLNISTFMGEFETDIQGTISGGARTSTPGRPAPPGGRAGATAGVGAGTRRTTPTPPTTPSMDEREFTVVYGAGDARISAESFNGAIRVRVAK